VDLGSALRRGQPLGDALKARDRRRVEAADRARQILVSLRSYLMASEETPSGEFSAANPASDPSRRASDVRK